MKALAAFVILACAAGPVHGACVQGAAYRGAKLRQPDLSALFRFADEAPQAFDSATGARLDAALEQARVATHAATLTAAIWARGRGVWEGRYPAGSDLLHYWASAGKAFTAVAILQMREERKLGLADPVSRWIDGVPDGRLITVGMLLEHTSGLYSANEDAEFRGARHRLGVPEALAIARKHGALFCPGTDWRYSNTGYLLLGAIAEKVDRKPFEQILQERIFSKLGPARIRAIAADDALADVAPPRSSSADPSIDPHEPGASGAIVADAAAMVAFERAWLAGRLLERQTVRGQFGTLFPMFGAPTSYGQGAMVYELPGTPPEDRARTWVGHSGGAPGVKAVFAYSLSDEAIVAVALTGDGSAEATANLLLRTLRQSPHE